MSRTLADKQSYAMQRSSISITGNVQAPTMPSCEIPGDLSVVNYYSTAAQKTWAYTGSKNLIGTFVNTPKVVGNNNYSKRLVQEDSEIITIPDNFTVSMNANLSQQGTNCKRKST